MKKAFIFQPDEGKAFLLSMLLQNQGVESRRLGKEDLDTPFYTLMGLPGPGNNSTKEHISPAEAPAMTVLSGFDSDELDGFLAARKAAGLKDDSLLAVLTPTNLFWTPRMLARELLREREEIRKNI